MDTTGLDDSGDDVLIRKGRVVVKINDLYRTPGEAAAKGLGRVQSEILRLSEVLGGLQQLMKSEIADMQKKTYSEKKK